MKLPDQIITDFYLTDTARVLQPPPEFLAWKREAAWAASFYEPTMAGAPKPRTLMALPGGARPMLNFSSFNYLGLSNHPKVVAAAHRALDEYGAGAGGTSMLSGRTHYHEALERSLAALTRREASVLFPSGFAGAMGAMTGVLRKGDVAIVDAQMHFSSIDGIRLSGARLKFFDHNDCASLDSLLAKEHGKRVLVGVEGVYSMDGDLADLPGIVAVAERHGADVYIDEAHSILACGETGGGVTELFAMQERIGLYYGTLSKAFGGVGGFVAGARDTIDYLHYFANTYCFATALPPSVVASLLAAIEVVGEEPQLRARLWENAAYFRGELNRLGIGTGESSTYIVPIMVGAERELLYECCGLMRERGLFLAPVDYPAVPADKLRYRACVSAAHSRADIDEGLAIIADVLRPQLEAKGVLRHA